MWILPLLIAIRSARLVCAAQANYTIDDTSPLVGWRAELWVRNPVDFDFTGLNISRLYNGTVTFVHSDPNATPTIAMNFSGECCESRCGCSLRSNSVHI